eukprot:GHVP01039537.1.p1 GENE.GHVP01039537.1~~GHVP01039537.1.p1  ORF type:complete len:216 (+),score=37.78 GHVP01039537.1:1010-1657(+)
MNIFLLILSIKCCKGETFIPDRVYKEVLEHQDIPAGCDIRVNISTGLKEARIMKKKREIKKAKIKNKDTISNLLITLESEESSDELEELSYDLEAGIFLMTKENLLRFFDIIKDEKCTIKVRNNLLSVVNNSLRNNIDAVLNINMEFEEVSLFILQQIEENDEDRFKERLEKIFIHTICEYTELPLSSLFMMEKMSKKEEISSIFCTLYSEGRFK